jgi:AdoMet-dependent heme synthase
MKLSKKTELHYALWEVTQKCNLRCIHCRADASPEKEEGKLIEGDDVSRLIDQLSEMGCPTLALTGGEPLLREDIVQIVKYATSKKVRTRIQSNAQLLTEDIADQLKNAGLFSYGVGMDGSNAEINDKIRNKKGAFDKSISAIKMLKAKGIKVHVEFTVTKINLHDLHATLDFLESIGVDTFLARAAIFTGRATADNATFRLSKLEYKIFLEQLSKERKERKMILNCQDPLYHLADASIVDKLKTYGDIYSGCVLSGCTAGLNMVHIHSNGDVGICTFLPNVILGNIFESSLQEIWDGRLNILEVKRLVKRDYKGKCKSCPDKFICGGCRARALCIENDLFEHDPYCWR